MNDLKKWIQIRKDLYLQIEKEVRHRLGQDTPELMRYHKKYQREFRKTWMASTKEALFREINSAQIVLMGDFHALNQSQKAQMRVIRHISEDRPLVLAVEFFEAHHQKEVDAFLAGRLSEKDFLKRIQWKERWGFAWENYRPLMRWAQKHKISVRALNKHFVHRTAKTLQARDVFAAKLISQLCQELPNHLVFVIYGDLHLAQDHIPKALVEAMGIGVRRRCLRIFQNAEALYFKLLDQGIDSTTDLIRLSDGSFCLQSVPPWVKWQNYLMYIERAYDLELEDEDEDDVEAAPLDYTEHVSRYVRLMVEELNLNFGVEFLSVYTARDAAFWTQVRNSYDGRMVKCIESLIAQEISFYLPEIQGAYLARPTVNHAAALALRYVHAHLSKQRHLLSPTAENFISLIWLEAVGYFGSKMINHKRKTDTIVDIKASLASRSPQDSGKEALQLALAQKMHELVVVTSSQGTTRMRRAPRRKENYYVAAKLLGGMLGERLYAGYRKGRLSSLTLTSFLKKDLESKSFEIVYYDIVELAESLPTSFKSKKEKL